MQEVASESGEGGRYILQGGRSGPSLEPGRVILVLTLALSGSMLGIAEARPVYIQSCFTAVAIISVLRAGLGLDLRSAN